MRVLVVGATGVVGRQMVPRLADAGHEVVATSRSAPEELWPTAVARSRPAAVSANDRITAPSTVPNRELDETATTNGGSLPNGW